MSEGARNFSLEKAGQQSLFAEHELDLLTIDQPETRKRYTAASLERNVAKRDAIVRAIAEGWGLLRIAKAFGVSHHLVSALRDSRADLVAIEKKQLSGQIGRILKLSADRFEEALVSGKVSPAQIPVAFGIFSDKKAMLDGDPGMVIEHRVRAYGSADGFRAKLMAAVDSESTKTGANPQQKGVLLDAVVVSDTSEDAAGGVVERAQAVPDGAGGSVQADADAGQRGQTPGGGDAAAAMPQV